MCFTASVPRGTMSGTKAAHIIAAKLCSRRPGMHCRLTQFINNQQKESDTKASAVQPLHRAKLCRSCHTAFNLANASSWRCQQIRECQGSQAANKRLCVCVCVCVEEEQRGRASESGRGHCLQQ